MNERTLEQDSLDKFEQKTLATIAALLHLNAVSHGFWDCPHCFEGTVPVGEYNEPCAVCGGTNKYRNFGESIALVISEYSEALEAARNSHLDELCDKCDGGMAELVMSDCPKCKGTGRNICGSRVLEELVDGLIRGMELAHKVAEDLGLDLGKAFAAKHRYNLTRPHKHNKEF